MTDTDPENTSHTGSDATPAPGGTESPHGQQPAPAQAEYGQFASPEFGKRADQYPGWDPYVYGKPEPPEKKETDNSAEQGGQQVAQTPQIQQQSQSQQQPQPQSQQWQNAPSQQQLPFGFRQVDPNDPAQNPYYGRWDSLAIFAFVLSLVQFPLLPLIFGFLAVRRTRILHTKGRGLAIAAIVLSVLEIVLSILLPLMGIDVTGMLLEYLGYVPAGTGGGTSDPAVSTLFML